MQVARATGMNMQLFDLCTGYKLDGAKLHYMKSLISIKSSKYMMKEIIMGFFLIGSSCWWKKIKFRSHKVTFMWVNQGVNRNNKNLTIQWHNTEHGSYKTDTILLYLVQANLLSQSADTHNNCVNFGYKIIEIIFCSKTNSSNRLLHSCHFNSILQKIKNNKWKLWL